MVVVAAINFANSDDVTKLDPQSSEVVLPCRGLYKASQGQKPTSNTKLDPQSSNDVVLLPSYLLR